MFLRRNRFVALLAAFALVLQALWPLLSHARPQDRPLLAPVCTVDGVTHYLEIKAGGTSPLDQRSARHGEHCKMCVFGDGKDVALAASDRAPFLLRNLSQQNSEIPGTPHHQAALLPSQARAPPHFS